jgi:hypothetical protein
MPERFFLIQLKILPLK